MRRNSMRFHVSPSTSGDIPKSGLAVLNDSEGESIEVTLARELLAGCACFTPSDCTQVFYLLKTTNYMRFKEILAEATHLQSVAKTRENKSICLKFKQIGYVFP